MGKLFTDEEIKHMRKMQILQEAGSKDHCPFYCNYMHKDQTQFNPAWCSRFTQWLMEEIIDGCGFMVRCDTCKQLYKLEKESKIRGKIASMNTVSERIK